MTIVRRGAAKLRQAAAQAEQAALRTRDMATAAEPLARLTDDTSDSTYRWIVVAQADGREAEQEAWAPGFATRIGPLVCLHGAAARFWLCSARV